MNNKNNEKKRKVSFSAVPQVKFIEQTNSSKTMSSVSAADESMELTTDITNAMSGPSNDSETLDLGDVFAQTNIIGSENKQLYDANKVDNIGITFVDEQASRLAKNEKEIQPNLDLNDMCEKKYIINENNLMDIKHNEEKKYTNHVDLKDNCITQNSSNKHLVNNISMNKNNINVIDLDTNVMRKNEDHCESYLQVSKQSNKQSNNNAIANDKNLGYQENSLHKNELKHMKNENVKENLTFIDLNQDKCNKIASDSILSRPKIENDFYTGVEIKNINEQNEMKNNEENNIENTETSINIEELFDRDELFDQKIANLENQHAKTADFSYVDDLYTTKDLRKMIPEKKINIMEVLEKYKIKFVDKNTLTNSKRKTISRQNEIKPELKYYYKYFAKEFYSHFVNFTEILESEMQKRQENILALENDNYDIEGINFSGIKKNCRIFAMNEWYLLRIERENIFNQIINFNRNKIHNKMERTTFKDDLINLKEERIDLENKINNINERLNNKNDNNFQDRVNNIKNYFKKYTCFNHNFIEENLKVKKIINENKLVDYLESEIEKRKSKEREKKMQKDKLEKEVSILSQKIKEIQERNNLKKITIDEMELERKKFALFNNFNKLQIHEINLNNLYIQIDAYHIKRRNNEFTVENKGNEFYRWAVNYINTQNFRQIITDINNYNMLYKEIKNLPMTFENDYIRIKYNNKTVIFNLKEIEILENEILVYKGIRESGMII